MTIFSMALTISIGLGMLLVYLLRGLRFREAGGDAPGWSREWFEGFSVETYKPMKRLLSESDFEYLRRQPGYTKKIEQRLRRERAEAFVLYMKALGRDFDMLYSGLNTLLLESETDQSDLALGLPKLKAEFLLLRAQAYCRMMLFRHNIRPVSFVPLLAPVATLRSRVQVLAAASAAF